MRCPGPPLAGRLLAATLAVTPIAACSTQPQGPAAPIAVEQIAAATAFDASAARQRVLDFVDAYAASPTEGVGALLGVVGGRELVSWVRWLDVQHREFPGRIDGAVDVRDVEFVGEIESEDVVGAQVTLSASVLFRYAPEDGDPFEWMRVLDGPVNLVKTGDRRFLVVDLLRDGVPMSEGIHLFPDLSERSGPIEVVVDSLHMFPPNWQFNVVVRNRSTRSWRLRPELTGLYVSRDGAFERFEGTTSRSLSLLPPGGRVEGILAYPMQDSAEGRVLTLAYGRPRDPLRFDFTLDGLVSAVPPPPPTTPETAPAAST